VGYAGGSKSNPTYHSLGNHSETIQIDYDPTVVTYEELLAIFWNSHNPVSRSISSQYGSVIFYHDEEQRRVAEAVKEDREDESGRQLPTEIVPYAELWLAEDYHQKYRLRGVKKVIESFQTIYPETRDLVDSTAAARANGFIGGNGTLEQFEEEVDSLGLPPEAQQKLSEIAQRRLR